jgi:hypothetical protein
MWNDAFGGVNEGLGTRKRVSLGEGCELDGLANSLRIRTERSKLSREVRMVASVELGGVQMKDSPRERTSCSVSDRILELRLWIPLFVIVLKIEGRDRVDAKLARGKGAGWCAY